MLQLMHEGENVIIQNKCFVKVFLDVNTKCRQRSVEALLSHTHTCTSSTHNCIVFNRVGSRGVVASHIIHCISKFFLLVYNHLNSLFFVCAKLSYMLCNIFFQFTVRSIELMARQNISVKN